MASAVVEKARVEAYYRKQEMAAEEAEARSPTSAGSGRYDDGNHYAAGSSGEGAAGAAGTAGAAGAATGAAAREDDGPALPPYSVPATTAHEEALKQQHGTAAAAAVAEAGRKAPSRYPGLPRLDYRLYTPPLFELSGDQVTLKTTAPYLSATVTALAGLVRSQASVPPKPMIHIRGSRGRKTDFAIKLNLMALLVPDDEQRRMNYTRCVGTGELALCGGAKPSRVTGPPGGSRRNGGDSQNSQNSEIEAWCREFVEDSASVKTFVLERQVANLDHNWLEGQIRSLVAATAYRGVVTVAFPVTHARVVVQSPDRVNKFFTTVTTLFTGKSTYEVVKAVWPFATHKNGEAGRVCAVQSEETWWREWRDPIRYAISTKRFGWVTSEDKLEALMEGVGKGTVSVDWGGDQ